MQILIQEVWGGAGGSLFLMSPLGNADAGGGGGVDRGRTSEDPGTVSRASTRVSPSPPAHGTRHSPGSVCFLQSPLLNTASFSPFEMKFICHLTMECFLKTSAQALLWSPGN